MDMITPQDVITRIERYYESGLLSYGQCSVAPAPTISSRMEEDARGLPAASELSAPSPVEVLIDFPHGLGDAVQLTAVLRHLRYYHPDWLIDVSALVGKQSAYGQLCRHAFQRDREVVDRSRYAHVFSLDWHECCTGYRQYPSTKTVRCLLEVFGLVPRLELCRYEIARSESAVALAHRYLDEICATGPDAAGRYPVVFVHYEGNTSAGQKNLSHELVRQVCEVVLAAGLTPVILDWDHRSPLPDAVRIHNPDADHYLWNGRGTGDAEVLAALIDCGRLMIGVDSGPLHVAGATSTPTIAVWTAHHPIHFFDLAANVLHLVPGNHEQLVHGPDALAYFQEHYRYQTYRELSIELPARVQSLLTGEAFETLANRRFLRALSCRAFNQDYYDEHKRAGLDYLGYGQWQQQYGRWLVDSLELKGKRLLDVGCACGAILRGLGEAGAVVQGVDINEHMIRLGRLQWPDMTALLWVCDAVNLHLFADQSLDVIHTAQVAEHWRAELVPHILREFARVVAPGGLLFCALDTEELFARQGRQMQYEDPTHTCVRPLAWWHEQLHGAGWELCTSEFEPVLRSHPEDFLARYDWDWFAARNRPDASGTAVAQPGADGDTASVG